MKCGTITLTEYTSGTDNFDLLSDVDGYTTPFETGVSQSQLIAGYDTALIPDAATIVRVQSNTSSCTNYVDVNLSVTPTPTPTRTPSVTPTRTPSVTPTPTRTPSITPTRTPSITPTRTPSRTPTRTPTVTPSPTPTKTPLPFATPSPSPGGSYMVFVFNWGSDGRTITDVKIDGVSVTGTFPLADGADRLYSSTVLGGWVTVSVYFDNNPAPGDFITVYNTVSDWCEGVTGGNPTNVDGCNMDGSQTSVYYDNSCITPP